MKQRVLFLDFDGVLTSERDTYRLLNHPSQEERRPYDPQFDLEAVESLRLIIQEAYPRIVAITSWKEMGIEYLQHLWAVNHMPGEIADVVPSYRNTFVNVGGQPRSTQVPCRGKGEMIEEWIINELMDGRETESYAILDDYQSFLPEQQPYFIQVDSYCGLSHSDALRAIELLSEKE